MKILIAEDDAVSRRLLACMLEKEPDYKVVAVNDGQAAWAELERTAGFDLALIDVMMPKLDGFELLERIRHDARFNKLPVILCSALRDRVSVTQAMALQVNHYIVKPFSRSVVLDKVRSVASMTAGRGVLDEASVTCVRLGIDDTVWRVLVAELIVSASQWIKDAEGASGPKDFRALSMQANALKGATVNLGAAALAAQFGTAEIMLANFGGVGAVGNEGTNPPVSATQLSASVDNIRQAVARLKRAAAALGIEAEPESEPVAAAAAPPGGST
jgi:CheY-like chemotaxis protein